ncbi:hypothetical protein M3Y94_00300800 [Aphelenchoides besseyi]|nr:hypothetical protein M3Y94_00300800 [Aphelenchoides besseyi]
MFEDENEEDMLPERRRVLVLQNLDCQRRSIRGIEELLSKCVRSLGTKTKMSKQNKMKASSEVRRWRAALGEAPVLAGCDIVNNGYIRLLSEPREGQKLFKVGDPDGWTPSFLIWNKQNHCKCNFFKSQVMEMNTTYLCPHLIAVRMAVLLNMQYKRPWPIDEDAIRYHGTKMSIAITKKQ